MREPDIRPGRLVVYRIAESDERALAAGAQVGAAVPATIGELRAGHEGLYAHVDTMLDALWVPSAVEGDGPGTWSWPTAEFA